MPDRERSRRVEELDRKLGILWSRFWALIVGSAGVAFPLWFFTSAENNDPGPAVFVTAIGLGLLLVARHLWRNKEGLAEKLDDIDVPTQSGKQRN